MNYIPHFEPLKVQILNLWWITQKFSMYYQQVINKVINVFLQQKGPNFELLVTAVNKAQRRFSSIRVLPLRYTNINPLAACARGCTPA